MASQVGQEVERDSKGGGGGGGLSLPGESNSKVTPDASPELLWLEDASAWHATGLCHHDEVGVDVAWQACQMVLCLLHSIVQPSVKISLPTKLKMHQSLSSAYDFFLS